MATAAKTRGYTEAENKALEKKLEQPNALVVCPRCGNEIIYEERGNSIAVECPTERCIFGGIRGL